MQIGFSRFGILLAGLTLACIVEAHHSAALLYDMNSEVEMQGTVTEYQLGNPHLRIYFDVENDGNIQKWMAEGGSRTVLLRMGWDGTELSPGDRIKIRGNPSRDGSNIIHVNYLTLPDGRELFAEDLNSRRLEQLRRQRK